MCERLGFYFVIDLLFAGHERSANYGRIGNVSA